MKKLIFIFCIGAIIIFPRVVLLTTYPPVIVDEPANVRDIQKILAPNPPLFFDFEWDFSMAMLVHYPSVAMIKLGISDPYVAIRLTSVVLSMLALIPFFFLAKKETDSHTAAIATILLSTNFFFLQFSRVGWTNMLSLTLGLYVVWFMSIAIQRLSYIWMGLTGCLIGLLLYTYRAGEVYVLGALALLAQTIVRNTKQKHVLFLTGVCIGTALIIASPWLIQIINHKEQYTLREKVVSVWNSPLPYHGVTEKKGLLFYQINKTIQSWILFSPGTNSDVEANRYMPLPLPMIAYQLIPLFWFGLVVCIRKSRTWIVWITMYITGLYFGQVLTVNPPNGSRGLILLPIMYMCIACGLFHFRLWNKKIIYLYMTSVILVDFYTYIQWMTWIRV